MKHYYAKHNGYGVNVSRDSRGWTIARFDEKKKRDTWVDSLNTSCNVTAAACTRAEAQYLLRKNIDDIEQDYRDAVGYRSMFWQLEGNHYIATEL